MLNPVVIELLDDPELGGGVPFLVVRETHRRSLIDDDSIDQVILRATGNIQPSQPDNLQMDPDEDVHNKEIVIRSTFKFQLGINGKTTHSPPDVVLWDGLVWDVMRVDDWAQWGFQTAYATERKEAVPDAYAAAMATKL